MMKWDPRSGKGLGLWVALVMLIPGSAFAQTADEERAVESFHIRLSEKLPPRPQPDDYEAARKWQQSLRDRWSSETHARLSLAEAVGSVLSFVGAALFPPAAPVLVPVGIALGGLAIFSGVRAHQTDEPGRAFHAADLAEVLDFLQSENPETRAAAVERIGELGDPHALPFLLKQYKKEKDDRVTPLVGAMIHVIMATERGGGSLGKFLFPAAPGEFWSDLPSASAPATVQIAAIQKLGNRLDPRAILALESFLRGSLSSDVRNEVVRALERLRIMHDELGLGIPVDYGAGLSATVPEKDAMALLESIARIEDPAAAGPLERYAAVAPRQRLRQRALQIAASLRQQELTRESSTVRTSIVEILSVAAESIE